MYRRRTIVASLLALGLLVVTIGSAGAQPPPIPSDYGGTVMIAGRPAPDGTTVQGKIDTYASKPVTVTGGKYQFLIVGPMDPTFQGKTITFLINGVLANETSTFEMGTTKTLNLSVASAPAQPPATAAATPPSTGTGIAQSTPSAVPPVATAAVPAATATPETGSAESSAVVLVIVGVVVVALAVFLALRRRR